MNNDFLIQRVLQLFPSGSSPSKSSSTWERIYAQSIVPKKPKQPRKPATLPPVSRIDVVARFEALQRKKKPPPSPPQKKIPENSETAKYKKEREISSMHRWPFCRFLPPDDESKKKIALKPRLYTGLS